MRKKEIIKHFRRMPSFERREKFMRENNIQFSCDRFHNVTVWAEDGTLQLFPIIN